VKVYSPEKFGRIVAHENMLFYSGNYETLSSKLAGNMRNAELNLKGATVIYGL